MRVTNDHSTNLRDDLDALRETSSELSHTLDKVQDKLTENDTNQQNRLNRQVNSLKTYLADVDASVNNLEKSVERRHQIQSDTFMSLLILWKVPLSGTITVPVGDGGLVPPGGAAQNSVWVGCLSACPVGVEGVSLYAELLGDFVCGEHGVVTHCCAPCIVLRGFPGCGVGLVVLGMLV